MLATDFNQLPLHSWLYLATPAAVLDSVIETPRYAKSSGPADGSPGIVNAWSGAAWDHVNNIMYLMGGGHGDTSICENALYALNTATLIWTRVKDRSPLSAWQQWDKTAQAFTTVNLHANAANGSGGNGDGSNCPLLDGAPGSIHNYQQLTWIAPAVLGNRSGGVYQGGTCRSVLDLDTGRYRTAHYWGPGPAHGVDWASYGMAYVDGNTLHQQRNGNTYFGYKLDDTEATTWSPNSFGRIVSEGFSSYLPHQAHTAWCLLRERREYVWFSGNQKAFRVRYGQAIDAGNLASRNWNSVTDTITLSSSDGSHLDFNSTTLFDTTVTGDMSHETNWLCSAGTHFDASADAAAGCIYVQANKAGTALYRITGIAGSTWQVQKLAGTAALSDASHYTFGRFRVAHLAGGAKLALRVTTTTGPLEVMRLG